MEARTAFSLLSAALSTANVEILPLLGIGCYIHHNRDVIVRQALDNNCTHLFQVDTDMMFGPNIINQLLAHDLDIVGCRYNKRILPPQSTVKENITTLSEVPFVPSGLLMVKTDVFKNIGKPWFSFMDDAESEDVYFCEKAKKHGYNIYCDPTIQVGHLGTAVF